MMISKAARHRSQNADLLQGATAQARIGLERRDHAALRAERVADELVGNIERKDEQSNQDRDPDRLIDHERRKSHIAGENAGDDDAHDAHPTVRTGSADAELGRHIGTEASLVLVRLIGEPAKHLGQDERHRKGEHRPGQEL